MSARLLRSAVIGLLLFCLVVPLQAAVTVLSSTVDAGDDLFFTTTSAIDTTGAALLVVCTSSFIAATVTDSAGNTWTSLTAQQSASSGRAQIHYVINPITSATHTFTNTASFPGIAILALQGTDDTTTFDQQNGDDGADDSSNMDIQPGSVTPSEADEIVVTCLNYSANGTVGISAPFSPPALNLDAGASNYGVSLAYEIQGAATARNPTWTHDNGGYLTSTIATFTVAGGGPPPSTARPCCLGVF